MKLVSIDGRSGFCQPGDSLTAESATFKGGFVFIRAKGTGSHFDTLLDDSIDGAKALPVGAVVKLPAWDKSEDNPLISGDEAESIGMEISCWTTDCPASMQEGEVVESTQCDIINGRRAVRGDGIVVESGTANGLYDTDSEMQRELEGLFRNRIIHKDDKVSLRPRKQKDFWHWFKYREMTDAGEVEVTLFRRMFIPQISAGQPTSGSIPFSFNYTTLETWQYEETIADDESGSEEA